MYICTYECTSTHIYTYTYMHTYTQTYTYTYTYIYKYAYKLGLALCAKSEPKRCNKGLCNDCANYSTTCTNCNKDMRSELHTSQNPQRRPREAPHPAHHGHKGKGRPPSVAQIIAQSQQHKPQHGNKVLAQTC